MIDHRLIRVIGVIVVPVDQRARFAGRECQGIHADYAGDIGLASGWQQAVAAHAHQRAGHHPEVFLQRRPALDSGGIEGATGIQRSISVPSLAILSMRTPAVRASRRYSGRSLPAWQPPPVVVGLRAVHASEGLGEIQRLDADASCSSSFSLNRTVLNEAGRAPSANTACRSPRTTRTDGRSAQIGGKVLARGVHCMQTGQL